MRKSNKRIKSVGLRNASKKPRVCRNDFFFFSSCTRKDSLNTHKVFQTNAIKYALD